jgi:hypothetical protein
MKSPHTTAATLAAVALNLSLLLAPASASASTSSVSLAGDTPAPVAHGRATLRGPHDASAMLNINVGLAVRGSARLDAIIAAASTPGSARYGHYLSNAQYMASFAPTGAQVREVKRWLRRAGVRVIGSSRDNLLVYGRASVATAERAFSVAINNYALDGRKFHANDRNPLVPANLDVHYISGLSNFDVFKPAISCTPEPKCGYDGGTFRSAYDIVGNGKGQSIGFTLWGKALVQADYDGYAKGTGTTALKVGGAGDDGLEFITVPKATTEEDTDPEVALDTMIAHGVAPGVHETYWLGENNENSTLEKVLNEAANSSIKIISNSWGAQTSSCPADSNMETSLQKGAATGKTFYFSTGDSGAASGCQYPAVSQYVVAVGGTNLEVGGGEAWSAEEAIENGGGCTGSISRPSWQTGIGSPLTYPKSACSGRAEPDVSANSGIGVYLYFGGNAGCCTGGTSLSTPIWAGASVLWNKHNAATGRPSIGFSAPLIYSIANDATTYAEDFHDITKGSNGFAAAKGWDEATGWGSPDFNKLSNNVADITYTGPASANKGDAITLSATLYDHGTKNPLAARTINFAAAGESCEATTNSSGEASCPVTIADAPGHYSAIAVFAGDAGYEAASTTVPFTVLHIPTSITYTGATTGTFSHEATLAAKLIDESNGKGIEGEMLAFKVGAESCEASTDSSGEASCAVTLLDKPGSYTVEVTFAGDAPTYEPSSTSLPFTLNKAETKLEYTGPLTGDYHDAFTATAKLTEPSSGTPIEGREITFTLGIGDTCTATTDTSGVASCSITPHQTGSQVIVAEFKGDAYYLASSDTRAFEIKPEETTLEYTGPTVVLSEGAPATLTATLVEDGSNDDDADGGSPAPVPSQSVTLSIGAQSCVGTSDSLGNVTCTIPSVTAPLGPETVAAVFAGDAEYAPSSDSKSAIVFAFPSHGAFVLGDATVAAGGPSTTVTWWSAQWSSLNSLSGGPVSPSFKGFASTVTLPAGTPPSGCTKPWSSRPGNSSAPPATVPEFMGTLVSSAATKSGSAIAGDTVKVVVVQTNPGYAPDPGSPGTGTVVATYC